jgi:uncharacterized protein YutE (UPF0331/DUF86 family)
VTDSGIVAKKLAYIETCVRELRTLARPEAIQEDIREQRFVAYTLQTAIQAALDVAAHIVADERLGEPRTNRALFEILVRHGWIPESLSVPLRQMAGFRNIVVHGYEVVDMAIVEGILRNHLDDLLAFVDAIRARI